MSDTTIEDWARLCALLDDDPELEPAVRQAVADETDAWQVLIDGLDEAGALAYLDGKDTGIELADALPALPRIFRTGVDVDEVGDVDGELSAAVVRADELLNPHGLRLVYLDEDTDAYPLVAVPTANVDEIIALSERLGHTARAFG
ncbi:DUF6630 family protein [Microbacterium sp. A84]|uniref:DUF6630 family protein n=1 Tax=Microbacterium sp. A84 TaxID=3450715 RepID=UPI003F42822A